MKKSFFGLMMALLFLFASCNPDDSHGGDKELSVNTYSVNGVVKQLNSVAMDIVNEYPFIVASPTSGLDNTDAIFACDEYLYAAVSPVLLGEEFDLMTESRTYTVMSTLAGAVLDTVAGGQTDEITAGKMLFSYENNVATVKAEITLADGTELKFHLSAEKQIVVNENTISRGEEKKPLRAAFYEKLETYTALYFTPSPVEYFDEMYDSATWYLYIMVENRFLSGEQVELSAESLYMFGVIDNVDGSNSVMIMGEDLQGATGSYSISEMEDNRYKASFDITVNGVLYSVEFDGTCISCDAERDKKMNYLTYKNGEYEVTSATMLAMDATTYTFGFSTSYEGKQIVFKAPQSFFNGNTCGFSQSDDFLVEFDGVTYSAANNSRGSITATYDASSRALVLDFTNYDNLQFNFTGSVAVAQ